MSSSNINKLFKNLNSESLKLNPLEVLREVCSMQKEIHKNRVEAKRIEFEAEVKIQEINSKKECFLGFIKKSFEERETSFDILFKMADKSIETNNTEQLSVVLDSIVKLAKEVPFKKLNNFGQNDI